MQHVAPPRFLLELRAQAEGKNGEQACRHDDYEAHVLLHVPVVQGFTDEWSARPTVFGGLIARKAPVGFRSRIGQRRVLPDKRDDGTAEGSLLIAHLMHSVQGDAGGHAHIQGTDGTGHRDARERISLTEDCI